MTTGSLDFVQRLLSSDSKYSEVDCNVVLTRIKVLLAIFSLFIFYYKNKHCEVLVSCSDREAVKSCHKLS